MLTQYSVRHAHLIKVRGYIRWGKGPGGSAAAASGGGGKRLAVARGLLVENGVQMIGHYLILYVCT